ncbi:TonB-dependent receptor plug domain-containing protein [Pseudomonas fluorescens]|uniref:TonB-dependent receptor plug domain-containing protein n=1 Tax=Pseudomonas fluorescens TaxID=294 RepID=UPI001930901D|nr:TonB-dependent receptor plug domain-containing protein [Pseudomonas fluorescens]MBD8088551.1 TonB-dependent receptor plug domain-containing protein [Pseudomonas fluorescens]
MFQSSPSLLKSVGLTLLALLPLKSFAHENYEAGLTLANATLPNNPRTSATALTVIDKQMIEASGARSIGEVLRIVPGVTTGYRFGHSFSIGSQGGAEEFARRVLVQVDDRPLFTPSVGTVTSFNMVPLEDVERIEVYRGPSHSEFGSNAMLLTIKIFTAYAAERKGTTLSSRKGGMGIDDLYVQHGGNIGSMDYTASYTSSRDTGLKHRDDSTNKKQFFARADFSPTLSDDVMVTLGAADSDIDTWVSSNLNSDDHDGQDTSWFLSSSWTHMFNDTTYVSTNLSNTYYDRDTHYLTAPVNAQVGRLLWDVGYSYNSTSFASKLVKNTTLADLTFGMKYSSDVIKSESMFKADNFTVTHGAYFANQAWHLTDTTTLHTGGMIEQTNSYKQMPLAYNASLVQTVGNQNTFRIGYSTGSRFPLVYEQKSARRAYLYDQGMKPAYDVYNTENLDPERMRSTEIAWMYESLDKSISTELRLYMNKYDSMVGYAETPNPGVLSQNGATVSSAKSFSNTGVAKGLEASIDWHPSSKLLLTLSGSYTDVDSYIQNGTYTSNIGESSPSTIVAALGHYSFEHNWAVGGMYSYVSSFAWSNGWELDSQSSLDLYVEKCFGALGSTKVCSKVAGSNLLGDQQNFRPEASSPRTFWFETSVKF